MAAAIVADACLLAARRRFPTALAGRWELPGGKVEPGETDHEAVVRECQEELAASVEVVGRFGDDVPMRAGRVLRGYEVRLAESSGEPVPCDDHDELRWLPPESLDDVPWLSADRPLVEGLRERLLDGVRLGGGNVGGAVRIGATVRRPSGPWTPTVFALLEHLHANGLPAVPRPLGIDARGREMLSYLPGETVGDGAWPAWAGSDELIVVAARWLRGYHEAVRTFRPEAPVWRLSTRALGPAEIVCHNDFAPYNLVVDRVGTTGELVLGGVLDWDLAGPGRPLDDLAFAGWGLVLRAGDLTPQETARRLDLLTRSYGGVDTATVLDAVPVRLRMSIDRIQTGARNGDPGMRRLLVGGAVAGVEQTLARWAAQAPAVEAEIGRR